MKQDSVWRQRSSHLLVFGTSVKEALATSEGWSWPQASIPIAFIKGNDSSGYIIGSRLSCSGATIRSVCLKAVKCSSSKSTSPRNIDDLDLGELITMMRGSWAKWASRLSHSRGNVLEFLDNHTCCAPLLLLVSTKSEFGSGLLKC